MSAVASPGNCQREVLEAKERGVHILIVDALESGAPRRSLRNKHPLFVAGGFGGAARAVGDLLLGKVRPEFSGEWSRQTIADYDTSRALYDQHGGDFVSLEHIGRDLRDLRATGLQAALNNGLDGAENEELILSTNPQQNFGARSEGLGPLSR